jgi:hypothetical protein
MRHFGPKPAAAGKGAPAKGGPSAGPTTPAAPDLKTPLQELVESGQEMIFGPPPGVNKVYGVHRDVAIPKLAPRIEIYAKKLRELYLREGSMLE